MRIARFTTVLLCTTIALLPVSGNRRVAAQDVTVLSVWAATDRAAIEPILDAYEEFDPSIDIAFTEFNTSELHQAILEADELPDLVISSAMDLQVDLVNRGYALEVESTPGTPDWSRWRDELFGFSREPVALVYDREAFDGRRLPTTRSELAGMLRDDPPFFDGRVGTYDIALSGVGYMFATQDAQRGYQASRLVESLGRADVQVYCCTEPMTKAVAEGDLVLAYNVMGSYASEFTAEHPRLGLLLLDDYALLFTRSIFVTKASEHPQEASRFVRYLLSPQGQRELESRTSLFPLAGSQTFGTNFDDGPFEGSTALLPIRLRPGLLAWLDDRKKETFLRDWRSSMEHRDTIPPPNSSTTIPSSQATTP